MFAALVLCPAVLVLPCEWLWHVWREKNRTEDQDEDYEAHRETFFPENNNHSTLGKHYGNDQLPQGGGGGGTEGTNEGQSQGGGGREGAQGGLSHNNRLHKKRGLGVDNPAAVQLVDLRL